MGVLTILLWAALFILVLASPSTLNVSDCAGVNGLRPQCKPVEAYHRREVFHVGGHYELNAQSKQNVLVDKMYVEKLTPISGVSKPYPLVFFHGGGYSGAVRHSNEPPSNLHADTHFAFRHGCRPLTTGKDSRLTFSKGAIKSIF